MIPSPETNDRINIWLETLRKDFYLPLGEISFSSFFTFGKLTAGQALEREFIPANPGLKWGSDWEYGWFKGVVEIPKEAEGKIVALSIDNGGESLIYLNGKPFGTVRNGWLNFSHHILVDNFITEHGVAGEAFELLTETYSGHWFPGCDTGPVIPGSLAAPAPPTTKVGKSTFGIWNEDAYQLWLDATALRETMELSPEGSLRAAKILEGLKAFTRIVDFEQPLKDRIASCKLAKMVLAPLMAAQNGSTSPTLYGIGHAHIDVAWLWPLQETERKTARTFAAQLRLLEKYPKYRFLQSQPQLYKMCKENYPDVYEGIKKSVKEGRWIAEGASWVEPDTNIPSGESLIRQILHGKRFFKQEFGVDCEIFWLPDTFGYSGALPQILKGCGLKYLFTQKIFWAYNEAEAFPYHSFVWQGIDGSQVQAFLSTNYGYTTNPKSLSDAWTQRRQPDRPLDKYLIPFGYGDGGGGPSRDHIEFGLRESNLEGVPRFKFASPVEFFRDLAKSPLAGNKYVGELYFSAHRGVYTSQAKMKKLNRKVEFALREAEMWSSLANVPYPKALADKCWETVLLNQFHDILPGSSIAKVYEEAEAQLEETISAAQAICSNAVESMLTPRDTLTVFNSLSWQRSEIIPLPESFKSGAVTDKGEKLPVCLLHGKVIAQVPIPSCGLTCIAPDDSSGVGIAHKTKATILNSGIALENGLIKVVINNSGEIESYALSGFKLNSVPMNRFHMYKDTPRLFDAWDIDNGYDESEVELDNAASVSILAKTPLLCSVTVSKKIGASDLRQTITIKAGSPVLEFDTEIEWRELHRILKVSFPTVVQTDECLNEIQFGYVKHPTHRSRQFDKDRFEVANHKYTALAGGNLGVAVLNNCKYGVSALDGSISLTLLRAPSAPAFRADNGTHRFTYAFMAWNGPFTESDVVRQGYELNAPPLVKSGVAETNSFFSIDSKSVIIDTLKPAEDESGDIIARLYESLNTNVHCSLSTSLPVKRASICDMLENAIGEAHLSNLKFKPFEVKTIRLVLK